jgi:RNA polymerase sigma-70 factor (ECF subfamily)
MSAENQNARLADLLSRAGLGDRPAFEELYNATRSKLFAVSLRIVRERQLAEEVLQDSFVSIWNHAADYAQARSAPTTWMTAIVRNRSLDVLRRGAHEVSDVDEAMAAKMIDESASPSQHLEDATDTHAVRQCLEELEAEQRQSIALAFYHGLSHSELAAHMRKPLGTVKTHIRRGLMRLRDCLLKTETHAGGRH